MTQKQYYIIVLLCNVLLLFAYIFKQNMILALNRSIQQQEQLLDNLSKKNKELFNEIQKLQQLGTIKKRAETELGMRTTKLDQIVTLAPTEA